VLIYNLQKKILYIVSQFQIFKLVHIKNKSFKNLRISSLCKLQLCKDCFLIRNTCICIYIILIFKFNINSFLYIYLRSAFNLRRSENVAFDKIECFCYRLLK